MGDADTVRRAMQRMGGFSCYESCGFFFRTVSAPDFGIRVCCFFVAAALRGGSDGSFSLLCFNFSCDGGDYWVFLGFITCLISLRLGEGWMQGGLC